MAEQRGEVAVQYQHALVMDGAGHVHFALDVEQAFVPGKRARRDAHGEAEAVVAQVNLCQPVELPHFFARKCNQPLAIGDGLLQLLLQQHILV